MFDLRDYRKKPTLDFESIWSKLEPILPERLEITDSKPLDNLPEQFQISSEDTLNNNLKRDLADFIQQIQEFVLQPPTYTVNDTASLGDADVWGPLTGVASAMQFISSFAPSDVRNHFYEKIKPHLQYIPASLEVKPTSIESIVYNEPFYKSNIPQSVWNVLRSDLGIGSTGGQTRSLRAELISTLAKEFSDVDLEQIVDESELANGAPVHDTINNTGTGCVLSFESEGVKYWVKSTTRKELIAKEAEYLKDAWEESHLRPYVSKTHKAIQTEQQGILITIDAGHQHKFLTEEDKQHNYELRTILRENVPKTNLTPEEAHRVRTLAITHYFLNDKKDKEIYNGNMSHFSHEQLLDRAAHTTNKEGLILLKESEGIYENARERLSEMASYFTVLAHNDARSDNFYKNRILIDGGAATKGTPQYDLSRLQVHKPRAIAETYLHAINTLNKAYGERIPLYGIDKETFTEQIRGNIICNESRIYSWNLSKS